MSTATPTRRRAGLIRTGLAATLTAMVAVTAVAALARALGADFELPDGGEAIPLPGFAVVTGVFSLIGVALAGACRRWSERPATHFLRIAVTLTAISLVPPFLVGATAATTAALLVLHLVAAAIVIPTLTRRLES
ncbi:DUF6069 family protein [Cryptosporangium phraense]|uniref:Cell envelope biogenesis protein OmpA n=1 Tax=Cryptosporangium phraense TaxID=2593070 RepID=A0A545ADT8_9ACTN|nr:DUF6069 family protein [Cryptosporangium phraense]TQS39503.1 hypothetical protein FL583_39655 [Cryptosporangium phraense]